MLRLPTKAHGRQSHASLDRSHIPAGPLVSGDVGECSRVCVHNLGHQLVNLGMGLNHAQLRWREIAVAFSEKPRTGPCTAVLWTAWSWRRDMDDAGFLKPQTRRLFQGFSCLVDSQTVDAVPGAALICPAPPGEPSTQSQLASVQLCDRVPLQCGTSTCRLEPPLVPAGPTMGLLWPFPWTLHQENLAFTVFNQGLML